MISEYVKSFCITQSTDYAEKNSVNRHNKVLANCRKIAGLIETEHPELKKDFYSLLDSDISGLPLLTAHHIIEVMNYDEEQKAKALNIIYKKAKEKSAEGFGNKLWLADYLKNNPQDKKLIKRKIFNLANKENKK